MIAKVEAVIPDRLRDYMANTALLAPSHHYMESISFDVADLRRALRNHLKVHFAYRNALASRRSERSGRSCLAYFGPVWLLSAWCELRDDFRTFRLDRIDGFVWTPSASASSPARLSTISSSATKPGRGRLRRPARVPVRPNLPKQIVSGHRREPPLTARNNPQQTRHIGATVLAANGGEGGNATSRKSRRRECSRNAIALTPGL